VKSCSAVAPQSR